MLLLLTSQLKTLSLSWVDLMIMVIYQTTVNITALLMINGLQLPNSIRRSLKFQHKFLRIDLFMCLVDMKQTPSKNTTSHRDRRGLFQTSSCQNNQVLMHQSQYQMQKYSYLVENHLMSGKNKVTSSIETKRVLKKFLRCQMSLNTSLNLIQL